MFLVKKKCVENKFLDQKITSSDFPAIIWGGTSNTLLIYFFCKKTSFPPLKKIISQPRHAGLGYNAHRPRFF